jgi:hypothetical protein
MQISLFGRGIIWFYKMISLLLFPEDARLIDLISEEEKKSIASKSLNIVIKNMGGSEASINRVLPVYRYVGQHAEFYVEDDDEGSHYIELKL